MNLKLTMIALKLVSTLLIFGMQPSYHALVSALQTVPQNELNSTVKQWQQELAEQKGFEAWKNATVSIGALGPGTHGWLVLVKNGQDVVGYMIVHATEDGSYVLGEYGVGDLQLLAENSDSLLYFSPFHAVIAVEHSDESSYIEPFMQEQFPIMKSHIIGQASQPHVKAEYDCVTSNSPALLTAALTRDYFSPYKVMPWLTGDALNKRLIDDYSIETSIELGSELRYTTESWNETVFSAYSITGYHEWNERQLYLALQDDNGELVRYIAYDLLMDEGYFYEPTIY